MAKHNKTLIGLRKIWFTISIVLVLPGTIALAVWGLKPGIDFRGGKEVEISKISDTNKLSSILSEIKLKDLTITTAGEQNLLARFSGSELKNSDGGDMSDTELHNKITEVIKTNGGTEVAYSSVGPSVSSDTTRNAITSVILASIAILMYLSYAFRKTPPPVTSWSFGVMAIIAMLHDALFVLGIFSILGHFLGVEVDALFVTAILTVIGFSVHDTIVVFDRIREKLLKFGNKMDFEDLVNQSIMETMARSLNTSLTVIITLLALYIFGGQSIKWFVLALLLGIISGTYSSIFNASPLLVVWNNYRIRQVAKNNKNKK